jgi:dipeptidyl aminopeptidase/acylaminoacyl peptidase
MADTAPSASRLEWLLELRSSFPADVSATHVLVQANLTGTMQLYRVPLAGGDLEQLTDEREPVGGAFVPHADRVLVSMDAGGNERQQLYLLAPGGRLEALVTDPRFIHASPRLSPDGSLLAYCCNRRNGVDFDVVLRSLVDGSERVVFARGGMCAPQAFSPDGRAVVVERLTERPGDNDLWLVPVADGAPELITPHDDDAYFGTPVWAGGHLYFTTSSGRDTRALVRQGEGVVLEAPWDLSCFADPAGRRLLVSANEDGYTRFELRDPDTLELLQVVPLPGRGVADDEHLPQPAFTPDGAMLVYGFTSPVEPGDVWAYDIDTGVTRRLTRTHDDVRGLVDARVQRVTSFDGEPIPLFLYDVPGAPVVIDIHGGPESQERPIWNPLIQWFAANGYAVAAPNVRGSTGYGRRYEHLDDVELRLDSVRDLLAIHDWLGSDRPAILWGGSYGGYMVLAGLAFFPERWAAGVDIVGISSLVTFLENTSAYRRAYREREYGSLERDRAFLESVSPLGRVDEIRAPLFVIHGANDPRVPLSEAEQLHASLAARGVPCELLVYHDEGHGLKKLENRLDAYPRAVAFLDRVLGRAET